MISLLFILHNPFPIQSWFDISGGQRWNWTMFHGHRKSSRVGNHYCKCTAVTVQVTFDVVVVACGNVTIYPYSYIITVICSQLNRQACKFTSDLHVRDVRDYLSIITIIIISSSIVIIVIINPHRDVKKKNCVCPPPLIWLALLFDRNNGDVETTRTYINYKRGPCPDAREFLLAQPARPRYVRIRCMYVVNKIIQCT